MNGTSEIHETITHQEEHREKRSEVVDVAKKDTALADTKRED